MSSTTNLFLYNSLSKKKEPLIPQQPGLVRMYVCGPTVYGLAHIGHARSAITFDIINRYLVHLGYKVKFVRNYTDVGHLEYDSDDGDDKVEKQARMEHVDPMEIAQRYINSYRNDMQLLNVLPPSIEPQASGYIQEQVDIVSDILSKGIAYINNGSVYFDVRRYNASYGSYGILSGRRLDDLRQETRVLNSQHDKRYFADFALWKSAVAQHIMQWRSPWGMGFPGWHTECVAISHKYLGYCDIHGGGIDLKFPHHECEIAQSRVISQTNLAELWIHNNLVNINNQKMSKSLRNFITLQDLFNGTSDVLTQPFDPMVLRFLMLQTHYRSTLDITEDALVSARKGYRRLINSLKVAKSIHIESVYKPGSYSDTIDNHINACFVALDDDLNTAVAMAHIFELSKIFNDLSNHRVSISDIGSDVLTKLQINYTHIIEDVLGIRDSSNNVHEKYMSMIMNLYEQAKHRGDYEQVDFIRCELKNMGLIVLDCDGTYTWRYDL